MIVSPIAALIAVLLAPANMPPAAVSPPAGPAATLEAEAVPEASLRAAFELYKEESVSTAVQNASAAGLIEFYQLWHDRLTSVAADAPVGRLKSRVLDEITTLSVAVGDMLGAAADAAAAAAAAADPVTKVDALFYEARVGRMRTAEDQGAERWREVAALQEGALKAYDALPAEGRADLQHWAVQAAFEAATLREAAGRHAEAAGMFDRALQYRAGMPRAGGVTGGDLFSTVSLLKRRAVQEVAAAQPEAAAKSVDAVAARVGLPPALIAFEAAGKADLKAAGGTFLLAWLNDHAADEYTPRVQAALAFKLDDAGREPEALALLLDLRESHAANLARLKPGRRNHAPYASVLFRLERLLREAGSADLAKEVGTDYRRRYPNDPRRARVGEDASVRISRESKAAETAAENAPEAE